MFYCSSVYIKCIVQGTDSHTSSSFAWKLLKKVLPFMKMFCYCSYLWAFIWITRNREKCTFTCLFKMCLELVFTLSDMYIYLTKPLAKWCAGVVYRILLHFHHIRCPKAHELYVYQTSWNYIIFIMCYKYDSPWLFLYMKKKTTFHLYSD